MLLLPQPHEEDVQLKAPEIVGKLADVEQLLGINNYMYLI